MELTNNTKDIVLEAVADRLEPAWKRAKEVQEAACKAGEEEIRTACVHAKAVLEREALAFKRWLAKNCKHVTLKNPNDFFEFSRYQLTSNVPGENARDAYDALRRNVTNRALRIASENPSKTAYAEVDRYLASIDPIKELGLED